VREGRTPANTLKYVFMATSANFGNIHTAASPLPAVSALVAQADFAHQSAD
jgi:hypothetical protein